MAYFFCANMAYSRPGSMTFPCEDPDPYEFLADLKPILRYLEPVLRRLDCRGANRTCIKMNGTLLYGSGSIEK